MNNKTLKVVSVIALSLLVMIVIVIYTPKPATQDRVSRKTLDEQFQQLDKEKNRLLIINEVLGKANEAARKVNKITDPSGEEVQFNDKGEPYLEVENIHPLIETNTKVIKELTKAVESVKLHSDELQSHSEKNAQLKSLIDAIMKANTKLISTLNELSEAMKALNELLKRFTSENAHLNISPANSVIKVLIKISKAQNADHHATAAHFAYIKALIKAK